MATRATSQAPGGERSAGGKAMGRGAIAADWVARLSLSARPVDEDRASVTLVANDAAGGEDHWVLLRLGRGEAGRKLLERDRSWLQRRPCDVLPSLTESGHGGGDSYLVGALPGEPVPLDVALRAAEPGSGEVRELIALAGQAFSRLRVAGLVHGALAAWKLLVIDGRTIRIHDWSRGRRRPRQPAWLAAGDLAPLAATIPRRWLDDAGLELLLAEAGLHGRLARRALDVGVLRAHASRLVPRLFPTTALSGPSLDIVADQAARDLFRPGPGLPGMLGAARVEELRRLPDRVNYRVIVTGAPEGDPGEGPAAGETNVLAASDEAGERDHRRGDRVYYMKSFTGGPEARDVGPSEWARTLLVAAAGIPTARPAATGRTSGGSFFMSHAVRESRPLDRVLTAPGELTRAERVRLADEVGRLVARLHGAGLCHRDLYLCHLLLSPEGLRLIDLQRASEYRILPRHRRVKDLASLHYASLATPIHPAERLRVLRRYLADTDRARRLRDKGGARGYRGRLARRRWIRSIERKAARIARHAGPPRVGGQDE